MCLYYSCLFFVAFYCIFSPHIYDSVEGKGLLRFTLFLLLILVWFGFLLVIVLLFFFRPCVGLLQRILPFSFFPHMFSVPIYFVRYILKFFLHKNGENSKMLVCPSLWIQEKTPDSHLTHAHTHAHTRAHTRARTRTHARTHAHTHTKDIS